MGESKSSINIEEIKRMQPLYHSLANLFQFLGDDKLKKEINDLVVKEVGPIAKADKIQFVSGLPKTRSGKIMRRILRKIAEGQTKNIGDISTLIDPDIVQEIKTAKE